MKRIHILSGMIATVLFLSCNDSGSQNSAESEEKAEKEKKITARDYSITPAVAYSDMFLDSIAMEKYISDSQLSDSTARRMRSFYNARNYQYAWFSTSGLTKQARLFWNQHDYATTYGTDTALRNKTLQKKMDGLIAEADFNISSGDKSYLQTELTLTRHFILFIASAY